MSFSEKKHLVPPVNAFDLSTFSSPDYILVLNSIDYAMHI